MGRIQVARIFLSLALGTVLAASLHGQDVRGKISGAVLDTSKAALVGANVTLRNVETGVAMFRKTDQAGQYLFTMVNPGTYTVTVEFQGFTKFVQENVILPMRGDITVDAMLSPGSTRQTVTVAAQASRVEFNTGKLDTVVNTKLANDLPQFNRETFFLAQLDPAVVKDDGNTQTQPYHDWGPQRQKVAGGQEYSNEVAVDGADVGIGMKSSYIPMIDSVSSVNVQANAVDSEYGHSSGSAITITTKGGSNEWHGSVWYQGQYPWLNAMQNRLYPNSQNLDRNNMYGGTLGFPILKNKLFDFVGFEGWHQVTSQDLVETLPTALERNGDFSQSLNNNGGLRTIYDPWSTTTSTTGQISRTPFPNNIIPLSRQNPIALMYIKNLWKPNSPGIGPFHENNYFAHTPVTYPYKNFTDRVDYNVSQNLRASGVIGLYRTPVTVTNPTGSPYFTPAGGSLRNANFVTENVTYTLSPNTFIDARGVYSGFIDNARYANNFSSDGGWAKIWPNSDFYAPVFKDPNIPVLIPRMSITGPSLAEYGGRNFDMGANGGYWGQTSTSTGFEAKLAQQRGSHYWKVGFQTQNYDSNVGLLLNMPGFGFDPQPTASTYINPNTGLSGDGFATFMLGAISPTTGSPWDWAGNATAMPVVSWLDGSSRYYAVFANDDWKLTPRLSLNVGFRYGYEQPIREADNRAGRPLNLNSPIPMFQGAGAPQMPAALQQYYSGPWTFNGAYVFADSSHRGQWDGGWGTLSPRVGVAYRLNSKTAIRGAYGRYVSPWSTQSWEAGDVGSINVPGYVNYTSAPPDILGVPQMTLSDPFPASYPITPSYGKSYGRYTGLGDTVDTYKANRPREFSDRFNIGVQSQLPQGVLFDVTYFLNLTNHNLYGQVRNINMADPRLANQYGAALNQQVANPFYGLAADQFPGPLRNLQTVSIGSLMKPYPQYVAINQQGGNSGGAVHYQSVQIKLQKSFSSGYTFLAGYNYHFERDQVYFDNIADYIQNYTWVTSGSPRHQLTIAGVWHLPLGRGQQFLTHAPRLLDALLGGWKVSGVYYWHSGDYPRFGSMVVNGDPHVSNPGPTEWFNPKVFSPQPAYTARSNPWYYSGITGPGIYNLDTSLVKSFSITEKVNLDLRLDSFNVLNNFTWGDPNTNVYSSTFGESTSIYPNTFGRKTEIGARIQF